VNYFRKFSEIFRNYWKILSGRETNVFRQVLKTWNLFRKFSEIIGKYCLGVRQISSGRFLKREIFRKFSEIIGQYCRGARRRFSSDKFLNGDYFFGNFRKLLENNVWVRDDDSLQTSSWMVIIFSEIFGNYWKIMSGCETNLFRQVLKRWIIFGNFRKLLENIFWV